VTDENSILTNEHESSCANGFYIHDRFIELVKAYTREPSVDVAILR
jgi:hypothetical protein